MPRPQYGAGALAFAIASCGAHHVDPSPATVAELDAGDVDAIVDTWAEPGTDSGTEEDVMFPNRYRRAAVITAVLTAVVVAQQAFEPPAPANSAPVMADLADVSGLTTIPIAITGSCTDDDLPEPPSLTYQWTKTGGPGSCTFASSTSPSTTATCDTAGAIVLTLSCCDQGPASSCTGLTDSDTLTATVGTALMLDRVAAATSGTITSPGCYMISHNVRAAYTGPSIRVRRSTDSAQQDIGFTAGGLLDEGALTTFCSGGATNCFVVTNYDKGTNARDLVMATTANQPQIVANGAVLKRGNLPVQLHVTGGTADYLARGDVLGFGLNPSISIFWAAQHITLSGGDRVVASLGGGGSHAVLVGARADGTLAFGFNNFGFSGGGSANHRTFTAAQDITAGMRHYLAQRATQGYAASITMRQNGVLLAQSSTGTAVLNNNNGAHAAVGGLASNGSLPFDGRLAGACFFDGLPHSAALDAIMDYGDALVAAAEGAPPAAPDITKIPRYIVVLGDSNAVNMTVPATDYAPRYGDIVVKYAVGGTQLAASWQPPSGAQYIGARDLILSLDTRIQADVLLQIGTNDANNLTPANNYQANMTTFDTGLTTSTGRNLRYADALLHTSGSATYLATVNTAKGAFGAAVGSTRWQSFATTPLGSLTDGLHLDTTGLAGVMNTGTALINSAYPLVYSP